MSIGLIEIIGEDRAKFKNRDNAAQELGDLTHSNLTHLGGSSYSITVNGGGR